MKKESLILALLLVCFLVSMPVIAVGPELTNPIELEFVGLTETEIFAGGVAVIGESIVDYSAYIIQSSESENILYLDQDFPVILSVIFEAVTEERDYTSFLPRFQPQRMKAG